MSLSEQRSVFENLIGFQSIARPCESLYAFISRLIRANLLNKSDAYAVIPRPLLFDAFSAPGNFDGFVPLISEFCDELEDATLKTKITPWEPFPSLSHIDNLRGCPSCFAMGYHSYAFQSDLMQRCPVHHQALVDACPHCGVSLIWVQPSLRLIALQCPAGCNLMDGPFDGLVQSDLAIEAKLAEQVDFVKKLRAECEFISAPFFVKYPPFILSEQYKRSPGLTAAIIEAVRHVSPSVPELGDYHQKNDNRWGVYVRKASCLEPLAVAEDQCARILHRFQRAIFYTRIPVLQESDTIRNLRDAPKDYPIHIREIGNYEVINAEPYVFLNSELDALRSLLMKGSGLGAYFQYVDCLDALLNHCSKRYERMLGISNQWEGADIAEWFEGLVRTPNGIWRVTATVRTKETEKLDWRSLSNYKFLFFSLYQQTQLEFEPPLR